MSKQTASIGEVGHATRLDRRPYQFRKSPRIRNRAQSYMEGVIAEYSRNGEIVAYENTTTGEWYDIDFSVETVGRMTYVTMWVNRQFHKCHVLEAYKDIYRLYSRVDSKLNETISIIAPFIGRASSEAYLMCSNFRDKLMHDACATVAQPELEVVPKQHYVLNKSRGFTPRRYSLVKVRYDIGYVVLRDEFGQFGVPFARCVDADRQQIYFMTERAEAA